VVIRFWVNPAVEHGKNLDNGSEKEEKWEIQI